MKPPPVFFIRLLVSATLLMNARQAPADPRDFPVTFSTYQALPIDGKDSSSGQATPVSQAAPVPAAPALPSAAQPGSAPVPPPIASGASEPASLAVAPVPVPAAAPGPSVPLMAQAAPALLAPPSPALAVSKTVSLDLREADIVEALKILSRQGGVNVVVGKNVSGRVTVFLSNVDFWEALRTILETRDLAYVKEAGLVRVITAQDYERSYGTSFGDKTEVSVVPLRNLKARAAKDLLEPLKSRVGSLTVDEVTNSLVINDTSGQTERMRSMLAALDAPRETRVFRLSYASVEDLLARVSPLVSKEFGHIQSDKRSNTLVVKDNPTRLREIEEIVKAFDVRDKAVLIEAKIVQVNLNKSFQWGVNWQGVNWTSFFDKMRDYHVSGSLVENLLLVPSETVQQGNVTAKGITAHIGVLERPDFKAVANFLDTVGNVNLLSSPRIMALNNEEAKIHVGSKEAKITRTILNVGSTTSNPVTTENVEFVDVGVKLAVTPSIGEDGMIRLRVKPEVSAVEKTLTTSSGSSIPVIRVSEAEASLVVKDGITVVIGGLIEDKKSKTDSGVPLLSRIPFLGYLFRSREKSSQKTELVIFLTPRIIAGETVSPEAQDRFELEPDGSPRPKKGFFQRLWKE